MLAFVVAIPSLAVATTDAQVQRSTIPEILARSGKSTSGMMSTPSGPPPSIDAILSDTDTILRATVGEPRSYLSNDQRQVYTDYSLQNPIVVYQQEVVRSNQPGVVPTMTVTVLGGTVDVNGLRYTLKIQALPPLTVGSEYLLLLSHRDDRYHIAGLFYGVFRIENETLFPVTTKQGFALEHRGALTKEFIEDVLLRLRAPRQ
jgi:hypothetical protein